VDKRGWVVLENCLCGCGNYPCIYIYTKRGVSGGIGGGSFLKIKGPSSIYILFFINDN